MRVDFYQLGSVPLEQVIARLADKLLRDEERLLVIAADVAQIARLDRMLWEQGGPTSFLPHGTAGGSEDSCQPVLLSTNTDAANRARNLLIADGRWREAALSFHRAFYIFGTDTLEEARAAWRSLSDRDGIEQHYWANEGGRWVEKAATGRASA